MTEVSILVPVKDGSIYIEKKLNNLIECSQSVCDKVQIIISVNRSKDNSFELIKNLLKDDLKIQVFRQENDLTMLENFQFLLNKAKTPFVCFSAVDDYMNKTFLSESIEILEARPELLGVKGKATFTPKVHGENPISFEIIGDTYQRCKVFIDNVRVSHAVNYAIYRRTDLDIFFSQNKEPFIGFDWAWGTWMSLRGSIVETPTGSIEFTANGISRDPQVFKLLSTKKLDEYLPYLNLAKCIFGMSHQRKTREKLLLVRFSFFLIYSNIKRLINNMKIILKN